MAVIKILPFTWTKLNAFETCPLRHLKVDLQKVFKEERSDQLLWGEKVHKAFEDALKTKNGKLPEEMAPWQKYIDRLRATPGEILVEQKFALTKNLQPCEYFAPGAWYRGKADVVKMAYPVAIAVDWKTGRRKVGPENKQLTLMAQCVFSHHPEIEAVLSRFVWLDSDQEDDELYTRQRVADEWVDNLYPRVERMLLAAETETYLPQPGGLCKSYCPVSSCQFHGKGSR